MKTHVQFIKQKQILNNKRNKRKRQIKPKGDASSKLIKTPAYISISGFEFIFICMLFFLRWYRLS